MAEATAQGERIGSLHHVSIQTIDWGRALSLYRDVLGLKRTMHAQFPGGKEIVLLGDENGTRVELISPPAHPTERSNSGVIAHIAFEVSDVAGTIAKIRRLGYRVTTDTTEIDVPGLRATIAFVEGPSGESIELIRNHSNGAARA